ncbi:MAG: DUF429 domain-containing protein [Thermodesulfobacteria bacterium]|nr:DUF429 domain-containing protein [Thermodesulfobacteriota bacterium]
MKDIKLVGIDGCRRGWLAVEGSFEPEKGTFRGEKAELVEDLGKILDLPARVFAIDMPLGLPDDFTPGGRECDRLARKLLGPRRGSIFTPPPARALLFTSYQDLRAAGIKISRQSFNLLPKMKELREILRKRSSTPLFETHPELVFLILAGEPLPSKHTPEGFEKRFELLQGLGLFRDLTRHLRDLPRLYRKDLLDAYACLMAAKRILEGTARVIPADPPRDALGLPMGIWF